MAVTALQNRYARVVNEWASLSAAVTAIGVTPTTLILPLGWAHTLTGNVTIPATITVEARGGVITTGGFTLTINGPFSCGLYQCFSGSGVTFSPKAVREVLPQWWGAMGDGSANDTNPIQYALDSLGTYGASVWLPKTTSSYLITDGLLVKYHNTKLRSNGGILIYSGTGYGLDSVPIATVYPQDCIFEDFYINTSGAGGTAIRWRFSHSVARSVRTGVSGTNGIGFHLVGDANGTGPYYNLFDECKVQGTSASGQQGVVFTADANGRAPNSNRWEGGRVGQVPKAFIVSGAGNKIRATIEGISDTGYTVTHASAGGAVDNEIIAQYYESGGKLYDVGVNSERTRIFIGYGTGFIGTNVDAGSHTRIAFPGEFEQLPVSHLASSTWGILICTTGGNIRMGWYVGNPEGAITAGPGSICMGADGNVYRKGSGTGNTGWVTM